MNFCLDAFSDGFSISPSTTLSYSPKILLNTLSVSVRNLTYTLVFQINDRWEVYLDDLVVKAKPPRGNAVPNTY